MAYREMAVAEYESIVAAEQAQKDQERQEFQQAGIDLIEPLFHKSDGSPLVPNWLDFIEVVSFDMPGDTVIIKLTDGSNTHFAVHPREGTVQLVKWSSLANQWQVGPHVTSLAEVGKVFAEGGW